MQDTGDEVLRGAVSVLAEGSGQRVTCGTWKVPCHCGAAVMCCGLVGDTLVTLVGDTAALTADAPLRGLL